MNRRDTSTWARRAWELLVVMTLPAALAAAMWTTGCSDTVACGSDSNCAPGYKCVNGACEASSGATPTS